VNVDVQASDWQTARRIAREDWRSFTLENGEQSAMISSTISMPELSATVSDSGRCWFR